MLILGAGNETVIGSFAGGGKTYVDSAAEVVLRADGAVATFYAAGLGIYPADDNGRHLGWTTLRWKQLHLAESLNLSEMAAPGVAPANRRLSVSEGQRIGEVATDGAVCDGGGGATGDRP